MSDTGTSKGAEITAHKRNAASQPKDRKGGCAMSWAELLWRLFLQTGLPEVYSLYRRVKG